MPTSLQSGSLPASVSQRWWPCRPSGRLEGRDRTDRQTAGRDRHQPRRRRRSGRPNRSWLRRRSPSISASEMAAQLGVPVEHVVHQNPARSPTPRQRALGTSPWLPKDPERETRMTFGPIYEDRGRHLHRQAWLERSPVLPTLDQDQASRWPPSTPRPPCAAPSRT